MLTLKLALRNIVAHRQRNLVIGVVTAAVSLFLFLFLTFSDGEVENVRNGVASFYGPPSDLTVYHKDYWFAADRGEPTADKTLVETAQLRQDLESVPGVKEAVPRYWVQWFDLYGQGKKYLGFNLVARAPRDAFLASKYKMVQGRDLAEGDKNAILLHRLALESLPFRPGDRVTVVGKDNFGQVTSLEVTVAGFFEPLIDNPNLYSAVLIDPATAATLSGYADREANQLLVRLVPGADLDKVLGAVRDRVRALGLDLDVRLTSANPSGQEFVFNMIRMIFIFMVLLTLVITGFGIMNVVSVNLKDRQKEIGTYFCLGSEKPFLMLLYTYEILFVNLGGAIVGIVAGLGVRELVNALAITSTDPGFQVVMGGSRFTLGLSLSSFLWILGGVTLITILTSLTTLGKALNVAPVAAVRETE